MAAILSALLLGLSTGFIPDVPLAPLAWVAFVPLLLALRSVSSFWKVAAYAYLTFFVYLLLAIYSFLSASFLGGTLVLFVGSLHFSFPFLILYFFRKHLGWRKSLWVLPLLWPAWEWSFLQSRFSVSFLTFHVTQAPLTWLVQFVDVLGSSAISFWLLLLNVLIVRAVEDWRAARTNLKVSRSQHGPSWGQKYQVPFLLRRLSVITLVMFLPPLLYSAHVFSSSHTEVQKEITVSLVQPNIDPEMKWTDSTSSGNTWPRGGTKR